jgi:FkbM family methyltransferase
MLIFDRVLRKLRRLILEREFRKWFSIDGDQTYRLNYALQSTSVVFDLGGYEGDFAHQIASKYGCEIHLYEPIEAFHQQCVERFSGNRNVHCHRYGLSNVDGLFDISNADNASSLIAVNNGAGCETVIVKRFVDEFARLEIIDIDLIKINIEGSEFVLLPHIIESGIINRINNIQVQFHDFFPDAYAERRRIHHMLRRTHKLDWCFPFVWESWSRL